MGDMGRKPMLSKQGVLNVRTLISAVNRRGVGDMPIQPNLAGRQ